MTDIYPKPKARPSNPNFSSGPCRKRPGWTLAALDGAILGRSHRSKEGKAKLKQLIDLTREVLAIPADYRIGIVPGSDTGAVEMALWGLLGPRGVDVFAWESFGDDWVKDIARELELEDRRVFQAPYGELPDLSKADPSRDVVFTWNGTTSGVRVPTADWIADDRTGLTICDATSAAFAMELPWEKLDVTTWSWQKVLGGEGAHGMIVMSPRAIERLTDHVPRWPMPKLYRMVNKGLVSEGLFVGETINTPSLLAVEDAIDGLLWARQIGGLPTLIARCQANFDRAAEWVARTTWCDFLASQEKNRSQTSICLKITDPAVADDAAEQARLAGAIVALLAEENVALDVPIAPRRPDFGSGLVRPSKLPISRSRWNGWIGPGTRFGRRAAMPETASLLSGDGYDHLYPCFDRADISFTHGEGAWLNATDGVQYLDFATGIAVTGLGHSHPVLVEELHRQGSRLWHVSNAVRIPEQEALARLLCEKTFADRVFFNNSGAEANETAIKTARRYQYFCGHPERYRIVTFDGGFHGRTLATVAAGGRKEYLEGFGPPAPGFDVVPFGDLKAMEMACGRETAAILLEPIQGESGVRKFSSPDLRQIRELCDRLGLLLIFDEVQTGIGRTGHLFAYQAAGVVPDLLASAKGLGNGFPVAVCLASEGGAASMTPGTHGSTFGGNPLAMAVAARVIEIIANETFLNAVRHKGGKLRDGLQEIVAAYPNVFSEVRGEGLLLGLSCVPPAKAAVTATRANGLLTVTAGNNVMRLLPPLTVSEDEIATGLARLRRAAESLLSLQRVVGE